MAETYKRVCLEDHAIADMEGNTCSVKRGKEYITGPDKGGTVIVFKEFWAPFPTKIFAGEKRFT